MFEPFTQQCSIEELYGVIQHEIEHLIRCHCIRVGDRDHIIFNYAADMAVNGKKNNPRIGYKNPSNEITLPLNGNIVWIPDNWDLNCSAEEYYDKLHNNDEQINGEIMDDHDIWDTSEVSIDEMRQVVKNAVNDVVSKINSEVPNHLYDIIKSLNRSVINWRQHLRNILGKYVGSKRQTYSRINRRIRKFGYKGFSHHAASEIVVIVDTSGSINGDELMQFFGEIENLSHRSKVWLLQWDNVFRSYGHYRKGDWKDISIKGRGNTNMAAPIEWLVDNKLVKNIVIMLTDGYCNYSKPYKFNFICALTTNDRFTNKPTWGHVVYLKQ